MENLDESRTNGAQQDGGQAAEESVGVHGTKAITRAMLILRLIARQEILGAQLKQLTSLTGIPHPTVRRVLKCLIDERLVVQDETTRRYRLGPLNFELGLATLHNPEFYRRFHPLIYRIAQESKDSTYLVVRAGADAVCLDRVVGTHLPQTVTLDVGGRRPLGFGAASLALLAQYSDPEVEAILDINKREIEVHRRVNRDRILRGIAHVREHGYSITRDISMLGTTSIGIVVPNSSNVPHFAISISSMRDRMTKEHIFNLRKIVEAEINNFSDVKRWPF
jgi:DNA-binding IclR family transcriptional regulator